MYGAEQNAAEVFKMRMFERGGAVNQVGQV